MAECTLENFNEDATEVNFTELASIQVSILSNIFINMLQTTINVVIHTLFDGF
jgi:hypothetical protein